MARKLLNGPAASTGIILSSAYRDYGRSRWKASQTGTWQDIHGNSRWVTLKVMKDNPYFDIDWNISHDHQDTWDSEAFRLTMQYSTNNKSSWSSVRDTKNYTQNHCFVSGRHTCGSSKGSNVLYNPTSLNLVAGNYIAFGIQVYHDGSSNRCYINQNSEHTDGTGLVSDVSYQGGGSFLRVREIDFSNNAVTLGGTVCNGTST